MSWRRHHVPGGRDQASPASPLQLLPTAPSHSSLAQLLPASRKLRASRAAARQPGLPAPRAAQGSRGRWDTEPVLRGVCAPGLGAKASARGRSPGRLHPPEGRLEHPRKHRLDFVCKISFPQAGAAAAQEQTAQRDPQMIPSGPESPHPGARGHLAHRSCTAHGGFFLEPPTSAPRYRDFAAMKCSFRKGNNKRKKQPVPLPRSAPCRTPRQNQVISLPLAPWSPCRCRQASSRLMCHQPKHRLSTNHRGFITTGRE